MSKSASFFHAAVVFSLAMTASAAMAQSSAGYPQKPVRIVIPYPSGSGMDVTARRLTPSLAAKLNGTVIVDAKPGAAGTIAAAEVARAPGDGYTLLMTLPDPLVGATALIKSLPYDPSKDFRYISKLFDGGALVVISSKYKVANVRELVEEARKADGKLTYASFGPGSTAQVIFEMIAKGSGVKLMGVPYKGFPPAIQDVLGDQIAMVSAAPMLFLPHIQSGKVVAIGITGPKRFSMLPNVPTLKEQGLEHYALTHSTWVGLVGPAALPPALTNHLVEAVKGAVQDPELRKYMSGTGMDIVASSSAEFERDFKEDLAVYPKIIRDELGVVPQ